MECPNCNHQLSIRARFCPNCGDPLKIFLDQEAYLKESLKRITSEAGQHNYLIMGVRAEDIFIQIIAQKGSPYIYIEAVANPQSIKKTKEMINLGFKLPGDDVKDEDLLVDDPSDFNFSGTFSIYPEDALNETVNIIFKVFYDIYEVSPIIEFDFKVILEKITSFSPLEGMKEY